MTHRASRWTLRERTANLRKNHQKSAKQREIRHDLLNASSALRGNRSPWINSAANSLSNAWAFSGRSLRRSCATAPSNSGKPISANESFGLDTADIRDASGDTGNSAVLTLPPLNAGGCDCGQCRPGLVESQLSAIPERMAGAICQAFAASPSSDRTAWVTAHRCFVAWKKSRIFVTV